MLPGCGLSLMPHVASFVDRFPFLLFEGMEGSGIPVRREEWRALSALLLSLRWWTSWVPIGGVANSSTKDAYMGHEAQPPLRTTGTRQAPPAGVYYPAHLSVS